MIAESAINGLERDKLFMSISSLASKLSTRNKDWHIAKNTLVPGAISFLGGAWDARSIAECISGSRAATDMGQGPSGRETVVLKRITR